MKKKKITEKEWEYIGKYNYAKKWARKFCSYYLVKEENGFCRYQEIGLILYILLFIPCTILQFFYCCWDGGIKEFNFPEKLLGTEHFIDTKKAKEIWDRK